MKFQWLASLLLMATMLVSCGSTEPEPAGPPNIVILFTDDMGYGDLSSYGHPTIHTPNLDRLAREGIRLTSFYVAAGACSPSRAALLTGRYPLRTGMPGVIGPDSERGMNLSEVTMADALQGQGYQTMAIGKWHIGHAKPEFQPTARGFDHYYGLLYSHDMILPWVETELPLELYRDTEPVESPADTFTITRRYTEEAVRFIHGTTGPFFLYLAYNMPHLPVRTSEEFRGKSRAHLYGDVIETIDWSSGQIMAALQAKGVARNTIVVFSSDNGPWTNMPPRMLHGGVEYWHSGSQSLLRGAKGTSYEGGMRVPGIIRWPARIPAHQVSADMASTIDLYTTFLEVAGAEVPSDRPVDGMNILSFLEGKSPSPREEFFYFIGMTLEAVRVGEWKLRMSTWARDFVRGQAPEGGSTSEDEPVVPELFNLERDPAEKWNVAAENPELVERLMERMRNFAAGVEGARLNF